MINNRGLKNRKTISNAVRTELAETLKQLSEVTKIPMSKLLDEALEDLINKNIPIEFSPEASVETTKAGVDDHLIKEILTNESVRHRLGLESLDIKHVEKE